MNNKHLACGIVALIIIGLIQSTFWVQAKRTKMQRDATAQEMAEYNASLLLQRERQQLGELRGASKGLIAFLQTWQPFFEAIDNPQSAEVNFTMKIKEDNLVNLAQRYELAAQKNNSSLPTVLRAYVTFEDDYARLLNWLGRMEQQQPTIRVSGVRMQKGTRANDLRMELVLEQPLLKK